ncbi:alpha/beta-hydrolase [Schizopora paradoxa]|uniref:Alpha/beta-hydrolase n=1 Tax=Schizopora paradoxa TaxID=27342 RepID=A0A0H2S5Q9_9AGAM|nr:alpha/beta-hydrolase [Schizopora paradoxa]
MSSVKSKIDVEYGSSSAQKLDLYWPSTLQGADEPSKAKPLICFVHGGAWRAEDKSDHAGLAIRLVSVTGCPVAVPNYCLTARSPTPETQQHHPAHSEDVLDSLNLLVGFSSPLSNIYAKDVTLDLYLIGHSCSAHMLTSIFLDSSHATPTLAPSPSLLSSVKAIAMSEGIYDIDLLIKNFPDYESGSYGFIANTFGVRLGSSTPEKKYADVSTTRYPARKDGKHLKWLIIHSKGDSLVDFAQSQSAFDHLKSEFGEDEVQRDFEAITFEHNEMLKTKEYSDLVGGYFASLLQ